MPICIRPYQSRDLKELLAVWDDATKLAHPFLTPLFLEQERDNIPALYLPNADTWVAEDNNRVIGFVALIGNEVGALFVSRHCHGLGFGRALMDKATSLHSVLEVDVFKDNQIGRRFYDRYGFQFQSESLYEATGDLVLRLLYNVKSNERNFHT